MPDKKPDDQIAGVKPKQNQPVLPESYLEEQLAGVKYLRNKFADLHASPEVISIAKRTEARTGKKVDLKPETRIANYLHYFREILDCKDEPERERGIEKLKRSLHKKFVIKPADVPESYFEKQKELVRQLGHGDVEITDETRRQLIENIIADQTSTLDGWLNYLTARDAEAYPDWARYWAFRSMLSLSIYDKEKKQFAKRRKDTVAPYPDLNREALAYVVDVVVKKAKGLEIEAVKDNPELEKIIQGESFARLYAYAIEKVTPADVEELKKAAGEWKTYKQGSDYMPLVRSLQGHGTGWCTAGESTAEAQLQGGDFHVYYSYDKDSKPVIPRIAIRMQGDAIGEVRGVAAEQNLDPYVAGIAKRKLAEFPDGPKYEKKAEDMRRLTAVEKKHRQNEKLTPDELRFLYEVDGKIEGFGYGDDPRIEEIKQGRNIKADYAVIYGVSEDQVIDNLKDLTSEVRVYIGKEKTYKFSRKATQKEVEAFSQIISPFGLACDLTEVGQPIKNSISKWEWDLKDGNKNAAYPNLQSVGGVLDVQNPEKLRIMDIICNRLKETPRHYKRPKEFDIAKVMAALNANPAAIASIQKMEATGGRVDIIEETDNTFVFADCSAESPIGRRDLDFDQSARMAEAFGVELMDGDTYRKIQEAGNFDLNSWSWLETDADTRKTGFAWFGRRRRGGVGVDRGGAGVLYPGDGWRGLLRVQKT
jgi:hypothetical protein